MFGLFSKKQINKVILGRQLTKDYQSVLRVLKRDRVNYCQSNGKSLSEMGKDLAHIERRTKHLYSAAVAHLKNNLSHDEAYQELINQTNSETDQSILEKLFVMKNKD